MRDEILFDVKNPKLDVIRCGCRRDLRGWSVNLLYSETSDKTKMILICDGCERSWIDVAGHDIHILPEVLRDGEPVCHEVVEGARR